MCCTTPQLDGDLKSIQAGHSQETFKNSAHNVILPQRHDSGFGLCGGGTSVHLGLSCMARSPQLPTAPLAHPNPCLPSHGEHQTLSLTLSGSVPIPHNLRTAQLPRACCNQRFIQPEPLCKV